MRIKTAADWWERHIDSPDFEQGCTAEEFPLSLRLLMCAMFERAWYDLEITDEVEPKDRRSSIAWFKGISKEATLFSFEVCASIIGITKERREAINKKVAIAEAANQMLSVKPRVQH